jgi:subtilisin family serine protease
MKGDAFTSRNIDGKGIRIAVFDGGFSGVDKSPIFQHLFERNQIIKTYDFVKKKEFVYSYMTHGTKVLSCIAGIYNNQPLGLATGAEYLLARTEIRPERHVEEHYWVAAMEWAAENNADIISCSLGYTSKLYPIEAMDGKTSIIAKAASIAARKGILVINSMGNDGSDKWEIMGTPADADSVLSVGGVNPFTGYHIQFSSFGPTFDKRMKPNITAPGAVMTWSGKGIGKSFGTSFSAPLISGFAACVWQMNRDSGNMQIFKMIEKSAHLYPYYDYAHGYGIPNAGYFFKTTEEEKAPPFQIQIKADTLKVIINDLNVDPSKPEDLLYYHIADQKGILRHYAVIKVQQPNVLNINLNTVKVDETVRFYYKNNIQQYLKK